MSLQALTMVFDLEGVTPTEKLVLLAFANFSDERLRSYPRQLTIARITGLSRRSVNQNVKKLEDKGLIQVKKRTTEDGGTLSSIVTLITENFPPLRTSFSPPANDDHSRSIKETSLEPKKGTTPPRTPPLPHGKRFAACWEDWQSHRKEIKKPLTPTSSKQQLNKLGRMSEHLACELIEHTISMGWQGLRGPDKPKHVQNEPPRSGNPPIRLTAPRVVVDPVDPEEGKRILREVLNGKGGNDE